MFVRPSSYFLKTKRSAVGSFCGYARSVLLCSCPPVTFVLKTYCVKTLSRIARGVAVPPGVSHIFPPHEKFTPPPVKFMLAAGAYAWRP